MMQHPDPVQAAGGGYGPPPGGYGGPPGGAPPGGFGAPGGFGPPGGSPMAPPGGGPMMGGPPGMSPGGGPGAAEMQKQAQTWLILSFVSIFCGCGIPFAIVPILFAFQAKSAADRGDAAEFKSKLQIAKICIFIGWGILVLAILLNVVGLAIGGFR